MKYRFLLLFACFFLIGGEQAQAKAISLFQEYTIPLAGAEPLAITATKNGDLWFTFDNEREIGHFSKGKITLLPLPYPHDAALVPDLITGIDGNLWFTGEEEIGKFTPQGKFTFYPTLNHENGGGFSPQSMTVGHDGNIWFMDQGYYVGKITMQGKVTIFNYHIKVSPDFGNIVAGPDGNVWFLTPGLSTVAKVTPQGTLTEYPYDPRYDPSHGFPQSLTVGPDGNLWFATYNQGRDVSYYVKMSLKGVTTFYSLSQQKDHLSTENWSDIVTGPDRNLWACDQNELVRLRPSDGKITGRYPLPQMNSSPYTMVLVGHSFWITENTGQRIARFSIPNV